MRLEFSQWGNFKLLDLDIPSVAYRIFAVIAIASLLAVAVYISRDQRIASVREAAHEIEIKFISEVSRMAARSRDHLFFGDAKTEPGAGSGPVALTIY
jgi:hypothetical protein